MNKKNETKKAPGPIPPEEGPEKEKAHIQAHQEPFDWETNDLHSNRDRQELVSREIEDDPGTFEN